VGSEILLPGGHGLAAEAASLQQFSVHVDETTTPGPLVEIIHVLGHQQQLPGPLPLEPGEGPVRRIGLHLPEPTPPLVVEALHELRIPDEALGRGHVLDSMILPEAIGSPEGLQSRFRRDTRPREKHQQGPRIGVTHVFCLYFHIHPLAHRHPSAQFKL